MATPWSLDQRGALEPEYPHGEICLRCWFRHGLNHPRGGIPRPWEEVKPEPCAVCDAVVPYSDAVHLTINTKSDAGVVDEFICPRCYESEIAAALE